MPPEPEGYAADDGKRAQRSQAVTSLSSPPSSHRGALREDYDQNGPDCYSPLLASGAWLLAPCPAQAPLALPQPSGLGPILCGTRLSACQEPMETAHPRRPRNLLAISFHPNGFRRRSGSLSVPHQGCPGMPCRAAEKQRTARQNPLRHSPPPPEASKPVPFRLIHSRPSISG